MTTTSHIFQNSRSPISRLPLELLTRIFLICQFFTDDDLGPYFATLITVSQVSRYWREVAIEYPNLWTDIYVEYPHWAEEMLRRSKNALIHIHSSLATPTHDQINATQIALHEIHRVKGLTLIAPKTTLEALLDNLPFVAPHIEHLELRSIDSFINYPHLILSHEASGGTIRYASRMRYFVLEGFHVKWASPFLCGLTHLVLAGMTFDVHPTLSQFVGMLQTMPMLEYLYISTFIASYSDARSSETPHNHIAELPHMSFLESFDAFDFITYVHVMERLRLPSSCGIWIALPDYPDLSDKTLEKYLKRFLAAMLTSKLTSKFEERQPYTKALIEFAANFRLLLSQACLPISDFEIKSSPYVDLVDIQVIETKENTIRILMEALPLSHLTSLFVNPFIDGTDQGFLDVGQNFWEAFLPSLKNLRVIEIGGSSALSFLATLTQLNAEQALSGNGSRQSDSVVCIPLLECIGFRNTHFGDLDLPYTPSRIFFDFFQQIVYHTNLERVSFTNCLGLIINDVRLLATEVDLRWDGQKIYNSYHVTSDSDTD